MRTTQIIIEHLIAGVQMTVWLFILGLAFFGTEWMVVLKSYINPTFLALPLVAFVYPLGIVIDNFADRFLKSFEAKIRKGIPSGEQSMTNLLIKMNDSSVEEQFDYIRTRIRISRSAALNFLMITLSVIFYVGMNVHPDQRWSFILFTTLLGLFLFVVSIQSWLMLTKSYYSKLAKRYRQLEAI